MLYRFRQMSGQALFLCVQNSDKVRKTKWWLLQWDAAHAVYDELIISEMSVVMKIGRLQEATQFTVTEIFTFLVTPCSSPLYPLLLRADATTFHAYKDYHRFVLRALILLLGGRNALGCWREAKTFMKHTFMKHTHTHLRKKKKRGSAACDVAADVISTHSFPRWQNVKTDSGATRWKGQQACFEWV